MATPADIVSIALKEDGYHDNLGYDEPSKYASFFGIDWGIAYCDIFVAWVFEQAGVPLPDMHGIGVAIRSGAQYCPDSWAYATARGAMVDSWNAQPGYQVIFNWNGDSSPLGGSSHTEIVERYDPATGTLYTVGGNSGPSNVDGFTGPGGVHRHAWSCPVGVGNSLVQGVIDTSKLVQFSATEDLVLSPDDKAFLTKAFADLQTALITVVEGGLDPAKNPFAIEGFRDLKAAADKNAADNAKIAAHLGVQL